MLTQYKESEDAELLWRLARASRDVAQLSGTSEEEKKFLVYEALEYAKRALEKTNPVVQPISGMQSVLVMLEIMKESRLKLQMPTLSRSILRKQLN